MIVTPELISSWRSLVDYQEQSIAYTRKMIDASATVVSDMSQWHMESPLVIQSRVPNRKEWELLHEMLARRYRILEERRRKIDVAMQDPLASCCAHLADYLAENGLSKPSDDNWKKSLEELCPEIGHYRINCIVYADEMDKEGNWIPDKRYVKDEDNNEDDDDDDDEDDEDEDDDDEDDDDEDDDDNGR
jgi:hypothetical protein